MTSLPRIATSSVAALAAFGLLQTLAQAQQARTYTTDADFDEGVKLNVNHTVVHDQLQLNTIGQPGPLPVINIAVSGRGTMVRIDTVTGQILGEFSTSPDGMARNPSRTAVDTLGNVWVGNRDEESPIPGGSSAGFGSVVKIGVCLGGTRVNQDGTPNPRGAYLKGPFIYNTCVDRNHDGLIHTSHGLGDILPWPNITDGAGGADGLVQDADDEAILVFQRTHGTQVRFVAVDPSNNVWIGGYPAQPDFFDKLDGNTGAILSTFSTPSCGGGHGGVVDGQGVLWSTSENEGKVLRYVIASGTSQCINVPANHGLGIDPAGNIWVNQFDLDTVTKISPAGTVLGTFPTFGAIGDRATCVTPIDSDVWTDSSAGRDVTRLRNDGTFIKVIDLGPDGLSPRGLAVDQNGKVWVACNVSNTVKRIDPNAGSDGKGEVDLTVSLGIGARPYDYSDMTGITPLVNFPQSSGMWEVTYDSGVANTQFGRISWNASVPANTDFTVEFRASNDPLAFPTLPFTTAQNGVVFTGVSGRYVNVRASFHRPSTVTATPVLFDLTIEPAGGTPPMDDCVGGIRNPASLLVFPEFDSRVGDLTLLSVTNTATGGPNVNVEFVYIGRNGLQGQLLDCLESNRTQTLTPLDTFSAVARAHNPNQAQGYVYVFAKDPVTGAAIVYNHLVGNELLINGIETLSYSMNPYAFLGIGTEGTQTDHDGDGVRDLNDLEYSCSPDVIAIPRFFGQDSMFVSQLIMINLTGGRSFQANVDFLVYNDNEEVFSAQNSFQCWTKQRLHEISGVFDQSYLVQTNQDPTEILGASGRETGWMRINGNVAFSPATSIDDPVILAVLIERAPSGFSVCDLPFEIGTQLNGDLLLSGILGDSTP
jgi:streptogramin lyase